MIAMSSSTLPTSDRPLTLPARLIPKSPGSVAKTFSDKTGSKMTVHWSEICNGLARGTLKELGLDGSSVDTNIHWRPVGEVK